CQQGNKHPYSF
nr:immunoglobulin light chain junction region [Macaca mulatta]MOX52199.1 immunoglobulin light chain junction region [Macaca mulatta]MOX53461.1 immunoglobulin light chain junction region [Macaca mulatta]MOX56043.1 immunoglobulin light chain junction region [Macaca mulatta]MOX57424.1 immunoglobulin light chain junction region [Macaca mulatta]